MDTCNVFDQRFSDNHVIVHSFSAHEMFPLLDLRIIWTFGLPGVVEINIWILA